MNPDEIQALKELIEFLQEKKIGEFRLERGELKVELKFEGAIAAAAQASSAAALDPMMLARLFSAAPAAAAAPPALQAAPAADQHPQSAGAQPQAAAETLHIVKSPIVGTFYEAPAPGSPAFVKVGDTVSVGQPICIVEAMKLMNEIECDAAGEIVERLVQNGQPIEYGQPLFSVRPR